MDLIIITVYVALLIPVYVALWDIERKIGCFERVCRDFDTLTADVRRLEKRIRGDG